MQAAELFSTQGYHATRMEDIAEACGITKAALYYYFPGGKTQILMELVDWAWELLVETPPVPEDLSPEEAFEALLRHHARVYLSHPELFDVLFREARAIQEIHQAQPRALEKLQNARRRYLAPYYGVLEGRVPPDELPHLMRAISGLVYAFLHLRHGDPEPDVDHLVKFARKMAFG